MYGETISERVVTFAQDRRARVPLALVGVVLLLGSVLIVGQISTRDTPEPDLDPGIAIDRTEALTQTAVRDGVKRAADLAAEQPLTEPASNRWGAVLNASNSSVPAVHPKQQSGSLQRETFINYLKALIYLEVQSSFEQTGETVGNVETRVSLPAITDNRSFRRAIERVELNETEPGTLTVRIANVSINATQDGKTLRHRETTINVTVATPILQLHERVETYQAALNAGITQRGFSQRFNARIYAIGWARGYLQNYRAPIVEVLSNRHIEPSVNSALYRTQQDIFGAADPQLQDAVRLGWTCMALKDGGEMFNQYMAAQNLEYKGVSYTGGTIDFKRSGGPDPQIRAPGGRNLIASKLCNSAEYLLGDQVTGRLPKPPSVESLLGKAPGMNTNETIAVEENAYIPLAKMTRPGYNHSFERVIDRLYTIEANVSTTVQGSSLPTLKPGACRNGSSGTQKEMKELVVTASKSNPQSGREYYEYDVSVLVTVEKTKTCKGGPDRRDTGTLSVDLSSVVRESEAHPDAKIDEINGNLGINHRYTRGPNRAPAPGMIPYPYPEFRNYAGAGRNITATIFEASTANASAYSNWASQQLSGVEITSQSDISRLRSRLETTQRVTLDHHEFLDTKLPAVLAKDIDQMQDDVSNITQEFRRPALIKSGEESPFRRLIQTVRTEIRDSYLRRNRSYVSVGQKVVYESRYAYLQSVIDRLETLETAHREAVGSLDKTLQETDSNIENALTFLQQGLAASEPDPVALRSSNLTGNITYEVSGSPTYLVGESLSKSDLSAVEKNETFAPLAMKNTNHFALPYEKVVDGIIKTIAASLNILSPDAKMTMRMAGDVLMAGELAVDANGTEKRIDNVRQFRGDIDTLRGNVRDAIDEFEREVATESVIELYPSTVAKCVVLDKRAEPLRYPVHCQRLLAENSELAETIADAKSEIETATEQALTGYNTTGKTAVAIGRGNATEPIIDNITARIDSDRYRNSAYEQNFTAEVWPALINSSVRPAVTRASTMKVSVGSPKDAKQIDNHIQRALKDASTEIIRARLQQLGNYTIDRMASWVGDWRGKKVRPVRVPAGLPLLPIPSQWYATVNVWDVEVAGQYARFELTANMGTPEHTTATTYVRENETVEYEIAGESRTLGSVEPVGFAGRSHLVVITPPGVGVGDRGSENPECSPHFPAVGQFSPKEPNCAGGPVIDAIWNQVGEREE